MTFRWISLSLFLTAAVFPASAQQKGPDALSRVFKHNNGTRTETQKMGGSNEIRETVYDKNSIKCAERVFRLDTQGRIMNGVIYDGKANAIGSTRNFFHPQTGQILKEELYNAKGQKIRELYYPGSLKEPHFAKRMVAFNFDPNAPKAAPRQVTGEVRPIVPTTKNEDEFEVGLPQGTAAPTLQEAQSRERNRATAAPAASTATTTPRRTWMRQKPPGQ